MMKKSVLLLCLMFFAGVSMGLAQEETIGSLFKDRGQNPVKFYIKEVINQSGQSQIATEIFKKELEASFHERRSLKFKAVNSPAESDIQISAVIKSYQYLDKGPLKPSIGVGTMLLDAAATMTENYVEMAVECTVIDTKSDKTLWSKTISEYIKKKMTPEESIPLIYDAITRAFVWRCFGKANLRDSNRQLVM